MSGHAVLRSHDNSEYGAAKHRTVRQGHLPGLVQAGRVFPSADSDPAGQSSVQRVQLAQPLADACTMAASIPFLVAFMRRLKVMNVQEGENLCKE